MDVIYTLKKNQLNKTTSVYKFFSMISTVVEKII